MHTPLKTSHALVLIATFSLGLITLVNYASEQLDQVAQYISVEIHHQTAAISDFDSNLVAHYTFDDTANDSKGSNNGTANSATAYVDGKIGKAINITSVDGRVGTPSDFIGAGNVTVCAWFFARSSRFASKIIDNNKFSIGVSTSNRLTLSSDGGASGLLSTNDKIVPNTWTHICGTRSSSGSGKWYINGIVDRAGGTGTPAAGTQHISLGNHPFTSSGWDGYLDDVRVYSAILTDNQIGEIYALGGVVLNTNTNTSNTNNANTTNTSTQNSNTTNNTTTQTTTDTSVQRIGTVVTATSCSAEHVQSAINSAQDGDTVIVPAGSCTWATTISRTPSITITRPITLKGSGIDQTIISDGTGQLGEEVLMKISGSARITGFTFNPATPKLSWENIILLGGQNWRIDHNKFDSFNGSNNLTGISVSIATYGTGVIDHNTFNNNANGVMIFGQGESSWTKPSPVGTANAVYMEDNIFNFKAQQNGAIDAYNGASYVFRFNTVNGTLVNHHGFDSGGYRAPYTFEIYNNTFTNPNTHLWSMMSFRGGSGLIFNNSALASGGSYDNSVILENFRSDDYYINIASQFGICNGLNSYDGNQLDIDTNNDGIFEASSGYPCRDQIGRGINQTLSPVYLWNNFLKGNPSIPSIKAYNYGAGSVRAIKYHILSGRDFHNNACPSNYTPYTYPHPLTGLPAQSQPLNCPGSPASVPGVCNSSINMCISGTFSDTADTIGAYKWSCTGLNGGASASCSVPIAEQRPPITPQATSTPTVPPVIPPVVTPPPVVPPPVTVLPPVTLPPTTPAVPSLISRILPSFTSPTRTPTTPSSVTTRRTTPSGPFVPLPEATPEDIASSTERTSFMATIRDIFSYILERIWRGVERVVGR